MKGPLSAKLPGMTSSWGCPSAVARWPVGKRFCSQDTDVCQKLPELKAGCHFTDEMSDNHCSNSTGIQRDTVYEILPWLRYCERYQLTTCHECAKPALMRISYLQLLDEVAQLLLQCVGALFAIAACHQPPKRPLGRFVLYKLYAIPQDLPASDSTCLNAVL